MLRRELRIATLSDISNLHEELRKGPITLLVNRDIFDEVEHILKKRMVLFSIEKITGKYVILEAVYPEHICHIHRRVLHKSYRLANPDVLSFLFKISKYIGYSRVRDQFKLADLLNQTCRQGYRFIFTLSRSVPSKGYIVCGGSTGSILAVVYEDYFTQIGVVALRYLFYRIPLDVFLYSIRTELLKKT